LPDLSAVVLAKKIHQAQKLNKSSNYKISRQQIKMKKITKLKLYTHHRSFLTVRAKNSTRPIRFLAAAANFIFDIFYSIGFAILTVLRFSKKLAVVFCYGAKNLLITPAQKIYRGFKKDLKNTKKILPERLKLLSQKNFARALLLFLCVSALGCGCLASLHLIANGLEVKSEVTQTAALGNNYLSQAKDALASQDLSLADNRFALAFGAFNQGQNELASSGQLLNRLMSLLPQKQAADSLLEAAALVSSCGRDFIVLQNQVKLLRIGPSGISSGNGPTGQALDALAEQINEISAKISQANNLVGNVDPGFLPAPDLANFEDLKSKLQIAQFTLNNFSSVFNVAENLLKGDKNVLVLFENNNELRAGGGFIGTYGNLKIHDGQISKINVSSIYDLDNQLAQNIQPPTPVLKVNNSWYMRDANWFADFPLSAQKVSDFYEMEGGETPDLIIAMTPNLISDWLKITGPITLPAYGVTLTSDNFVEQTQAVTTLSNLLPTNSPKQILADLIPVLLQKISQSPPSAWSQIIQSIQNNLNNKQIVIYSRDSGLENQLAQFNWAGAQNNTDRDYLSVVSSNLGATKTDLYVDQQIKLITTVAGDGSVIDEVDITRTNKMPDLPDAFNNSFIRIYAPLGSKLISNLGFDYLSLDYPSGENYQTDPDVYNWEKNSVKDVVTGTYIGQESGKTFFGNWLNISGGQSRTVKLVYRLPFKLSGVDKYSLLLQKQIGAADADFNWTFNFAGRQISWKNFNTQTLNTDNLNSDIILDKDYFFGMVLSKR